MKYLNYLARQSPDMKYSLRWMSALTAIFGFSSCSVYYSTNQVDASLKTSLNQANTSLSNLELQIQNLQSQYNNIQCDVKNEPMKQADKLYANLQSELSQINTDKAQLNQEYIRFQEYTKGKDRIVSGTPEFTALKATRESIKTKMTALQIKGEHAVQTAQGFSDFISKQVVPTIQVCDVPNFKSRLEKAIAELSMSKQNFEQELKNHELQVSQYVSKNGKNSADLKLDMDKLGQYLKQMDEVKSSLELASAEFNAKTMGHKTISTCSKDWPIVGATESSILANQQKMDAISNGITDVARHIQWLIGNQH